MYKSVLHITNPEFWALEVAKHTGMQVIFFIDLADAFNYGLMVSVRAVAEVEAAYINPGFNDGKQIFFGGCCRPDSSNYFGPVEVSV